MLIKNVALEVMLYPTYLISLACCRHWAVLVVSASETRRVPVVYTSTRVPPGLLQSSRGMHWDQLFHNHMTPITAPPLGTRLPSHLPGDPFAGHSHQGTEWGQFQGPQLEKTHKMIPSGDPEVPQLMIRSSWSLIVEPCQVGERKKCSEQSRLANWRS